MSREQIKSSIHEPFDLHLHSSCSDGSDAPAEVARSAAERDVTMLALADHDNVLGVPEAAAEAARLGIRLLPAIEMTRNGRMRCTFWDWISTSANRA